MSENSLIPASSKAPILSGDRGLKLSNLDEIWRFATAVSKSGLAPKGIDTPESITVALQMGAELGLPPMAALQNIAVINGRPSVWGDAQLGIVRATGELEEFEEWFEQGGERLDRNPSKFDESTAAVCRVRRKGYAQAQITAFSVEDAKRANLWGKTGPWSQYPARMLRFRARSFGLRDQFGDALRGLLTAEEARDIDPVEAARPVSGTVVDTGKPSFKDSLGKKAAEPVEASVEAAVERIDQAAPEPQDNLRFEEESAAPETPLQRLLVKAADYGKDEIEEQLGVIQLAGKRWAQFNDRRFKRYADLSAELQDTLEKGFDALMEGGK
ncbi:MAG: recombinase RecT [Verrucomicrobium sp.]|nr:recombinase RecT [Verrucomicrobium sp.]